jgi:hypothetical protein
MFPSREKILYGFDKLYGMVVSNEKLFKIKKKKRNELIIIIKEL